MWTPDLLRRPGQGDRRASTTAPPTTGRRAQQLRRAEPRATPCWSTAARSTAPPSPGSGSTRPRTSTTARCSVYQTPTSDFTDHADALETSCDLPGRRGAGHLRADGRGGRDPDGRRDDVRRGLRPGLERDRCGRAAHRAGAVQLQAAARAGRSRRSAVPGRPPRRCGEETFEDGLAGWEQGLRDRLLRRRQPPVDRRTRRRPEAAPAPWPGVDDTRTPGSAPRGRATSRRVDSIISPEIVMPATLARAEADLRPLRRDRARLRRRQREGQRQRRSVHA